MKIILKKSFNLSENKNSWFERKMIVNKDGVEQEITQLVIPQAILSTTQKDVQGDAMSQTFLEKAFTKAKNLFVNVEHVKDSVVGHIERVVIEKGKAIGDIVVESIEAIADVKAGKKIAFSLEGYATEYKVLQDGTRLITDGLVKGGAITSNPANKDCFFKSDDLSIPEAVEVNEYVLIDGDFGFAKSDTSATPAPQASTDAQSQATDTQTATDTKDAVEPADKQAEPAQPAPGQAQIDVDTVDTQALQVEIMKDLEKQLKEAKEKLEEATTALAKSNEQAELVKSADTAKKKLENENYILKMSVATIKKAEESYKSEIETLKKSLEEANAKVTALNDEIEKTPVANKINKSFAVVEDEVEDEFAKEYLVFDKNGNIDKQKTLAKALSMSVKNTKITD